MRLLLLNANTSPFVTDKVAHQARLAARAGTEIVPAMAAFGARIIATRTELAIAEHATLDALAHHAPGCDAVVLAVSYDTALYAAREMLGLPVVGITEAALLSACMLGTRTGVVMFGPRVLPLYQERARLYGLDSRIAAWRALETLAPYGDGDQSAADDAVVAAACEMVEAAGCEVIVLAGAVMAGVPSRLQARVPVPVIEGVSCAVAQAEMLAGLGCPRPRTGSLAALPARALVGVSPALASFFGDPAQGG